MSNKKNYFINLLLLIILCHRTLTYSLRDSRSSENQNYADKKRSLGN